MRSTLPRATLRARRRSLRTAVGEKPPQRLVEQQVEVVALDKDRVMVETAMRLDGSHGRSCFVGEGLARRLPLLSVLFVSFFGLSCMCVFECVWDVCLCWAAQGGGTRRPRLETSLGQIWAPA